MRWICGTSWKPIPADRRKLPAPARSILPARKSLVQEPKLTVLKESILPAREFLLERRYHVLAEELY